MNNKIKTRLAEMSSEEFKEIWTDFCGECAFPDSVVLIDDYTPESIQNFADVCALDMTDVSHEIVEAQKAGRLPAGSRYMAWVTDAYEAYRYCNDPSATHDYIPKAYGFNDPKDVLKFVPEEVAEDFVRFLKRSL